jgi:hypothetical protein
MAKELTLEAAERIVAVGFRGVVALRRPGAC